MTGGPSYDLQTIQDLVARRHYYVTDQARADAWLLDFDTPDIEACIAALDETDFYKTMPSLKKPGLMQDVYKTSYQEVALYVKVQIGKRGLAVVISFKEE